MGYAMVMSPCINCRKPFSYNPHRVPSIRINGVREPVCQTCIETANRARAAQGIPAIEILPGAYDPIDESEL